jgi:hypothetical protein
MKDAALAARTSPSSSRALAQPHTLNDLPFQEKPNTELFIVHKKHKQYSEYHKIDFSLTVSLRREVCRKSKFQAKAVGAVGRLSLVLFGWCD